ncbi:uncharacterized protein N7496_005128 [Penicillium cataractarum]|uniref:DUF1275 domain protein n=1 Tax=Penicillium cataractarum TaxID=2100454 RepID=A0A9W9SI63_9EURO|nr:uncharacterized protein N7496_005128 [Penicillium cataractarum]KAJ5377719.1 hypothetical protein N7496_005128 [Penicillium cataractarum]
MSTTSTSTPKPLHQEPEPIPTSKPHPSPLKAFLNQEIRADLLLETQLLILTFLTGIQDASTWLDYTCFASNQTGNTIFLALSLASSSSLSPPPPTSPSPSPDQPPPYSFPNITTSLTLFITATLTFGQLGNHLGPHRRSWLLLSNLLQTIPVLAALALQLYYPITRDGPAARAVIGCLAFSSGGQVAMARALGMTEITTAMATAALVDVGIDARLWRARNRGRNRRLAFLGCLVLGCLVGAVLRRVGRGVPLLVCVVGKGGVFVGVLFNRGVDGEEGKEKEKDKGEV